MRALPTATAPHPVDVSYLLHERNIISSTIDQGHGQNTSKSQLWTKKRESGLGVEVVLRHFQSKGNLSKLPHPPHVQSTFRGQRPPWQPVFSIWSCVCTKQTVSSYFFSLWSEPGPPGSQPSRPSSQFFWFWFPDVSDHGLPGLRDVKYRHFLDASKPARQVAARFNHRAKRSPVFGSGVKVCPQDTMKEVISSHRTYYKLRGEFNSEFPRRCPRSCRSPRCKDSTCVNMLTVKETDVSLPQLGFLKLLLWCIWRKLVARFVQRGWFVGDFCRRRRQRRLAIEIWLRQLRQQTISKQGWFHLLAVIKSFPKLVSHKFPTGLVILDNVYLVSHTDANKTQGAVISGGSFELTLLIFLPVGCTVWPLPEQTLLPLHLNHIALKQLAN